MDLVAKTNFTLDNLSQNLSTIKNELSPFVNQLEVVKRTIGTSQTKHELEIGNLLFSGDSPLIWYKQCFSQINSRLEGSIDSYYKLKKIQLKIEKLVSKESLKPKQNLKLNKLQTDYVRLEGYIQNAISEMQHYKNVASKMKKTFDFPDN